jgi:O-antigen/teichoic acid export membrane protein
VLGRENVRTADVRVQGIVAITAGIIVIAALLLPWLSSEHSALSGMNRTREPLEQVVPMTLVFLAFLTIFGGTIHIAGYKIGIKIATVTSAVALFISVMVIVVTLANANANEGNTLNLLVGPWIGAAGAIFGVISSLLERK